MEIKEYNGKQRYFTIEMPEVISGVPGISIFGRILKSFIFTTDIALIKNHNADAIMAIYPFTTQPAINSALVNAADVPVFCGIGGVNTPGERLVEMATQSEYVGAAGMVVNPQVDNETLSKLHNALDIPLVATIVSEKEDFERRIESGADIFNISGAENTCRIIEHIKNKYPYMPIIATGGPSDETILETIGCGADAISFSPPTNAEIFKMQMQVFRESLE